MTHWVISDLHFQHENMLRGRKISIRPFDTLDQMHEAIIEGWNSRVKPRDKVTMLGDLTLQRPRKNPGHWWPDLYALCHRLHGQKRIVLGNHDHLPLDAYADLGFEKVFAMRVMGDLILTHVPVHPGQLGPGHRFKGNVHGHTHETNVGRLKYTYAYGEQLPYESVERDPRYLNVCVEPLNYTPISLEECRARIGGQA